MSRVMVTILSVIVFTTAAVAADGDSVWEKTADLALIVNQSAYSDNWSGDELGTLNWTFTGDVQANRPLGASTMWNNQIKLAYGKTRNEVVAEGGKEWAESEKATDRVFWESLVKFSEGSYANPYVAFTFESQFHDAADNMLTPALYAESAGMGRDLVKDEATHLFSRIGFAYRQRTAHSLPTTTDGGIEFVTDLSHTFNEQVKMVSKLRLFQAFTSSADDDLAADHPTKDHWKGTDVAWEVSVSASVSKYIQTTLFFEVLYDKEIDGDSRWRDILGVGVTYKLF